MIGVRDEGDVNASVLLPAGSEPGGHWIGRRPTRPWQWLAIAGGQVLAWHLQVRGLARMLPGHSPAREGDAPLVLYFVGVGVGLLCLLAAIVVFSLELPEAS